MTFKDQVIDLISFTPNETKLTQYLKNAVNDVINKIISLDPGKKDLFVRKYTANPTGSITIFASGANTTVTSATHGLLNGDIVNITGSTAYDAEDLTVSSVTENTFDIITAYTMNPATGTWVRPNIDVDISKISKEIVAVTIGHEGLSWEQSELNWGDTTAEWYPTTYECVPISPAGASLSKNAGSLHYRTISDAAWYLEDNKVKVVPVPDGVDVKMEVFYVDYPVVAHDTEPSNLIYFPQQYVQLIPLNAAISILQDNLSTALNTNEDIELSQIQMGQHTKLKAEYNEAFALMGQKA